MGNMDFTNLRVWQEAKNLAVLIYKITEKDPISKDFSFKDQIRRSATSIPSNIAEGNDRETYKEFIRFLYIAKGSTAELLNQVMIGKEIGYFSDDFDELNERCMKISKMIGSLIKTIKRYDTNSTIKT